MTPPTGKTTPSPSPPAGKPAGLSPDETHPLHALSLAFRARAMEALPSVAPPQSFLEPRPAPTLTAFKQPPAEADSTSSSLLAPAVTRPRPLTATTTTISLLCRGRAQGGAPRAIAAWPPDPASAVPDLAPWASPPPTGAHAGEGPRRAGPANRARRRRRLHAGLRDADEPPGASTAGHGPPPDP